MKKREIMILLLGLIMAVISLTSCATRVSTSYMVPAEYDMSGYRSLAIASTIPYRFRPFEIPSPFIRDMSGTSPVVVYSGSRLGIEKQTAAYVTEQVNAEARKSTYFTLASTTVADTSSSAELLKRGYQAYMTISHDDLDINEYIYAKEETIKVPTNDPNAPFIEEKVVSYYIEQEVHTLFSWEIRDTLRDSLLASDSYAYSNSRTTKIDDLDDKVQNAPSILPILRDISSRFADTIFPKIVPTTRTASISLMKNSPKNYRAEDGYEAVKDGNLKDAFDIFEKEWKRRDHIPSLYNAALILEALGKRAEGIDLLEKGYRENGNTKIQKLLSEMTKREEMTAEAQSQL